MKITNREKFRRNKGEENKYQNTPKVCKKWKTNNLFG